MISGWKHDNRVHAEIGRLGFTWHMPTMIEAWDPRYKELWWGKLELFWKKADATRSV